MTSRSGCFPFRCVDVIVAPTTATKLHHDEQQGKALKWRKIEK
jgi:hypothetical protein